MRQSLFLVAVLLASNACMEPVCACSPTGRGGGAVVTGTVTDPSGVPVAGARVMFQLLQFVTCVEPGYNWGFVESGVAGRYRHSWGGNGGSECFHVWAEPPQGSGLAASDTQALNVNYEMDGVPDSVELNFQLRP